MNSIQHKIVEGVRLLENASKFQTVARELKDIASKHREAKAIVDKMAKGQAPTKQEIANLQGEVQDEVVMAIAGVFGPTQAMKITGQQAESTIAEATKNWIVIYNWGQGRQLIHPKSDKYDIVVMDKGRAERLAKQEQKDMDRGKHKVFVHAKPLDDKIWNYVNKRSEAGWAVRDLLDELKESAGLDERAMRHKPNPNRNKAKFDKRHIDLAVSWAKKMEGDMTGATKKIEDIARGLSKDPKVQAALQQYNESVNEGGLSAAMKRDDKVRRQLVVKAKAWMKKTKKGPEDAAKEFDISTKDLSEAANQKVVARAVAKEGSNRYFLGITADRGRPILHSDTGAALSLSNIAWNVDGGKTEKTTVVANVVRGIKDSKKLADALNKAKLGPKKWTPILMDDLPEETELDPVNPKAVKKKFKNRKDKDIDNDGDVDSSDEYLHKRRKVISKNVKEASKIARAISEATKVSKGQWIKGPAGDVFQVLDVRGTTVHAAPYRGKNSFGGETTLHITKVKKIDQPTDAK